MIHAPKLRQEVIRFVIDFRVNAKDFIINSKLTQSMLQFDYAQYYEKIRELSEFIMINGMIILKETYRIFLDMVSKLRLDNNTLDQYTNFKTEKSDNSTKSSNTECKHNFGLESSGASLIEYSRDSDGASGILSGSKDKYLIIPSTSSKSFVISLSEDAIIDNFMIRNSEEFSCTIKDFELYGSDTFVSHDQKWDKLGSFTAKKLNNQWQSFKFKEAWVRYLKLIWKNSYGNHYYCTLSQIKACGRTMVQGLKENLKNIDKESKVPVVTQSKYNETNNSSLLNMTDSHQSLNITSIIKANDKTSKK